MTDTKLRDGSEPPPQRSAATPVTQQCFSSRQGILDEVIVRIEDLIAFP
jgi:hypothetical protein